jgi:hypothetical protein
LRLSHGENRGSIPLGGAIIRLESGHQRGRKRFFRCELVCQVRFWSRDMDSVLADDDLFQHEPKIGEVDPGFGTRGLI